MLKEPSLLAVNSYITDQTLIGKMGNTGWVDPAPSIANLMAGTHLHYQLMGNLSGYGPTSSAWGYQNTRRNLFLNSIGAPAAGEYIYNAGTSSKNNYTPGSSYSNYFYNVNEYFKRKGLYVSP